MLIDGLDSMHEGRHERDSGDSIFFEVLTGVARKNPAGVRFGRLMEDLNSMSTYLHDIRLCFIALTILIYAVLIGYLIQKCIDRRRKNSSNQRRQWDFQVENPATIECRNQSTQLEDLVSVRSDGQLGNTINANSTLPIVASQNSYMNRNHRSSTPSMRHARHQLSLGNEVGNGARATEKTKLMATDQEAPPIKHQIPHIITSDLAQSYGDTTPPVDEASKPANLHSVRTVHHRPTIHQTMRTDSTDM